MTADETKNIINEIKTFRPFFQTGLSKKEDMLFFKNWHKVFEPYDFTDVESNLDKWLKESGHFGKTPEPYELTSGLLTISQKEKLKDKSAIKIYCPICHHSYSLTTFDNHFGKCSSVEFVVRTRLKYFGKSTDKEKLWNLPDEKFKELYLKYCEELVKKDLSDDERDSLLKVLDSEVKE